MPILLDEKKKEDKHLFGGNKGAKVRKTSFKYVLLIILLHWPSFCLLEIGISIFGENHIEKGGRDNLSLGTSKINGDGRADNPSIGTNIADAGKETNNSGISIETADIDKKVDDVSISRKIVNPDRGTDNPGIDTDIANINRKADNPGKGTNIADIDADRGADSRTGTNTVNANIDANG